MNTLHRAFALSLAMIASSAFAKTSTCFNPYQVRIVNQSGGEAELVRSKDISGFRKGIKYAIPNFKSKDIVVEDLGANITVEHGVEDREKTDRINFYEKTGPIPTVILKGTSIEVRGFNQQKGQQYNVTIQNESGGKAKIIETCDAAIRGDIDAGSSRDVRVRAGSTISLNMGPKGNKKAYKIRFSTATQEGNPTITLNPPSKGFFDIGSWFRPAISGKNIRFGAGRVGSNQPSVKLGPQAPSKKTRSGACGKNVHVTTPDAVAAGA